MHPGEEWLGWEFPEVLAQARPFRILVTRPSLRSMGRDSLVVVGQRQEEGGLCLILSYREFVKREKSP